MPVNKKFDVTDQQEETPMELYYHIDSDTGVRYLHKESYADGEVMGVTETWGNDRHEIMVNRANAHGYKLVERGV